MVSLMPRIPKVVGVRQNTKDGLWKDFGERLVRSGTDPLLRTRGGRRGNMRHSSRARLNRAFREEDAGDA